MPEEDVFGACVITLHCSPQIAPNKAFALECSEAALHLANAQPKVGGERAYRRINTPVFTGVAGETCPKEFGGGAKTTMPHEDIWDKDARKQPERVEGLTLL